MSRAEQAHDEAARWIIARENGEWSGEDQAQFERWLAQSDGNKAAYWRLSHSWSEADRIGSLGIEPPPASRWHRIGRFAWPAAIAASLALVVAIGAFHYDVGVRESAAPVMRYDTPVGGRRTIALADGSQVELNTRTVVRTAVTGTVREVWLDSGEAFFSVVHDPAHPFVVLAGTEHITVLGTKFSVRRDGDKVTVSVLQGKVRIDPGRPALEAGGSPAAEAGASSATVTAGAVAVTTGPSMLVVESAPERVTDSLAWRQGTLKFDQQSLAEVAGEFNRYNRRRIIVADQSAASLRISGSFRSSDIDAFARLLHDAYDLQVTSDSNEIRISS